MTAGSVATPLIIPIRLPSQGQSKQDINTSTLVEITSDSSEVIILYTVDGSKPEVVHNAGCRGNNSTLTYTAPILLPQGRVTVRAVAVTSDGRHSATVTKVFMVKQDQVLMESKSRKDDENFMKLSEEQQYTQEASLIGSAGDASWLQVPQLQGGPNSRSPRGPQLHGGPTSRSPRGPRFLNSRLGPRTPVEEAEVHCCSPLRNLTNTQRNRVHRETHFLRCAQCLNHRPSDPFARFCLHCGFPLAPVPGGRSLPPTEGGQMALCVHCNTMVPVNTGSCLICEAPLPPHPNPNPQACLKLQGKVLCPSCGTGNPGHIFYCVTCESRLPLNTTTEAFSGESAPPLPSGELKMVSCSKCRRINHSDARFCDWCGSKPVHQTHHVVCSRCGASSHPYAGYCGTCGVFLEGPERCGPHGTTSTSTDLENHLSATWKPLLSSGPSPGLAVAPPLTADSGTQTAGLFYPSAAHIHRTQQQGALDTKRQEAMRDRRPLLTAVSPGRGYWRQQVDHVCAHLRSYAQNNPDFRTLIGEPHMGHMVSAVVQEDNFEVSLRINFVSVGREKDKASSDDITKTSSVVKVSEGQSLSSVTEGKNVNTKPLDRGSSAVQIKAHKQKLVFEAVIKAPLRDRQLLKEVGPEGRGQVSVIQQLLDEGADPSCEDGVGRPALAVAVLNGHHQVLPVLVQRGSDINQQYGPMNNTALHEAAALGEKGLLCTETLLGCKASLSKKNRGGLTPYDLAVTSGCEVTMALLTARMGQNLLDSLRRGP